MDPRLRGDDEGGRVRATASAIRPVVVFPHPNSVIPANAGTHGSKRLMVRIPKDAARPWVPAFAGMTVVVVDGGDGGDDVGGG